MSKYIKTNTCPHCGEKLLKGEKHTVPTRYILPKYTCERKIPLTLVKESIQVIDSEESDKTVSVIESLTHYDI